MFKLTNPPLIITTWSSLDHKRHKVAPQTASPHWSILMTLCAASLMRLLQVSELWRAELAALWITKLQTPLRAFIDSVAISCTELICQQICKTYAFCFAHICTSGQSWIHRLTLAAQEASISKSCAEMSRVTEVQSYVLTETWQKLIVCKNLVNVNGKVSVWNFCSVWTLLDGTEMPPWGLTWRKRLHC